ncbi:uncharacterized protein [Misgurnus anguillicaudatus]|uniref:uncharacterized protein n=1 Tax=Misgurnus anguillicaudatus TaxID=75329 RepID=UPI003CCFC79D
MLLSSVNYKKCDFLLDLCSHVKDYESKTGSSVLPALQSIYQSSPAVWTINLSKRKTSILLEVLKVQTEKKPVELIDWTDDESEVRGFIQCMPYISHLRFIKPPNDSPELWEEKKRLFILNLCLQAAVCQKETIETTVKMLLSSVNYEKCDFLLDLCSHVKDYESQTGSSVLPALQSIYQSSPAVWIINLSERKTSILLEVLKVQTEKKPVELIDWTDDESEVRGFIQCLPYISQLRFCPSLCNKHSKKIIQFLVNLFASASECETDTRENYMKLLTSVCSYTTFPCENNYSDNQRCDFLLDLYSHVKDYESQTGRSVLPALQSIYQSSPAVWTINLSERKTSILLEVLKLQTEKKPVKLIDWTDDESEVRGFIQCLPYISQLRFIKPPNESSELWEKRKRLFILDLCLQAAVCQKETIETTVKMLLSSVKYEKCDFLLDLCSHVKDYESQTGSSVLPRLQSIYQSSPGVWIINLSERKTSILLEVLKLQTEKKPVELIDCTDDESEVRGFIQCLPYISQLRFIKLPNDSPELWEKRKRLFILDLYLQAAVCQKETIETTVKMLLSSVNYEKCDFLLDLYSHVKDYESQTASSVLPALQSIYQSSPEVWIINLSERKTSILLEVLKLQTEKKPVELIDWTEDESEVRGFIQCLPYISQLRFTEVFSKKKESVKFLVNLFTTTSEFETNTEEKYTELLTSVCNYTTFPCDERTSVQSNFLLDLYSHLKDYESQTGRSVLPALQSIYQSSPAVWTINLSERKTSILLEVLKLQTEKKPVKLIDWTDDESEATIPNAIDVAHRTAFKHSNESRPRAIIIAFIARRLRDALWKAAKSNEFLKNQGLQFKKDLTKKDRDRQKLWPLIKKAREEGKPAYFVGHRAFIEGAEISEG